MRLPWLLCCLALGCGGATPLRDSACVPASVDVPPGPLLPAGAHVGELCCCDVQGAWQCDERSPCR